MPSDTLRTGQRLRLTSTVSRSGSHARLASSDSSGSGPVTYVVRAGDTLYAIAKLFQVTVKQISAWNGLHHSSFIKPGQKLTIRVSSRGG